MIQIEKIVPPSKEQWEFAIEGMRNPYNSWGKSDSFFSGDGYNTFILGENDLSLMKNLIKAGTEHRKFLRQLPIGMRIKAPLYWYKEFETYKVGTTSNSCSTMHKLTARKFVPDDFSFEYCNEELSNMYIKHLNEIRELYLKYKEKDVWYYLIQMLPSSYNQIRNITMNYEVLLNIVRQRERHKLDEWQEFCDIMVEEVPMFKEFKDVVN